MNILIDVINTIYLTMAEQFALLDWFGNILKT